MAAEKRPVVAISMGAADWVPEVITLAALLFMAFLLIFEYPHLPSTIPTHFNFQGTADGWGSKETIFFMPAIFLLTAILLTVLCKYPHTFNYPVAITAANASRQYALAISLLRWMKAEIALIFAYIEWITVQSAINARSSMGIWFALAVMLLLLGTIAAYIFLATRRTQ
jgi:uncharacterized membrane protein